MAKKSSNVAGAVILGVCLIALAIFIITLFRNPGCGNYCRQYGRETQLMLQRYVDGELSAGETDRKLSVIEKGIDNALEKTPGDTGLQKLRNLYRSIDAAFIDPYKNPPMITSVEWLIKAVKRIM